MHKQLFFIISLYLIIYSFSADTDPCATKTDSETCKADTTNNCEWTATQASCAAATCTGLNETACGEIKSCKWDSTNGGSCGAATPCSNFTNLTDPTCGAAATAYCVWTDGNPGTCTTVDCTKLAVTTEACVATKGCSLTPAGGSCAKKGTSGGSTGSAFGLKTSLTLLIIGFLL